MPSDVIWFSSDEAGAPVLNNAAGSMVAVLDACLVNGFNSGTTTISVTAGVATATRSAHGFLVGRKVLIEGATPSGLNGVKKILSVATNTFTFDATGVSNGAATGTITSKRAPLGWAIQYTGTNRRIYRRTDVAASAQMLRVDDRNTAPSSDTAARAYGVETATAIDTVGVRFPTNTQLANGQYWLKGAAASTGAKDWVLIGDGKSFYFSRATTTVAESGSADSVSYDLNFFGDINSYKPADAYPALVIGASTESGGINMSTGQWTNVAPVSIGANGVGYVGENAIARSHSGTGGAVGASVLSVGEGSGANRFGGAALPLNPSPVDSGTLTLQRPVFVCSAQPIVTVGVLRGEMPGFAQFMLNNVSKAIATKTVLTGVTGVGAGRDFMLLRAGPGGNDMAAIDITGPWW